MHCSLMFPEVVGSSGVSGGAWGAMSWSRGTGGAGGPTLHHPR